MSIPSHSGEEDFKVVSIESIGPRRLKNKIQNFGEVRVDLSFGLGIN